MGVLEFLKKQRENRRSTPKKKKKKGRRRRRRRNKGSGKISKLMMQKKRGPIYKYCGSNQLTGFLDGDSRMFGPSPQILKNGSLYILRDLGLVFIHYLQEILS